MRALAKTLLIAFIGCMLIALAAPAARLIILNLKINDARALIAGGSVDSALQKMRRFQPWALRYPSAAANLAVVRTRCHVLLGQLAAARAYADWIYDRDITASAFLTTLVEAGPDWLLNKVLTTIDGKPPYWDRNAGYDCILIELERAGQFRLLEQHARSILKHAPHYARAQHIVDIVDGTSPVGADQTPATRTAGRAVTPNPPPGRTVVSPTPPTDTLPDLEALRARESALVTRIQEREAELADDAGAQPGPELQEYNRIASELQREQNKAQALQNDFNSATGSRRADIMDELQRMKGPLARLANEYNAARARLQAATPATSPDPASDPRLRSMKQELADIRARIQSR